MTGYGRGVTSSASDRAVVEVRVLNSRYLDQKLRGLDVSAELELKIRERVRDVLQRGSVSVTISRESENG
ncbi:MAG: YicC/YloC family endoribonuclease, partial [Candidatus Neomarinimicrobiota bacterium]